LKSYDEVIYGSLRVTGVQLLEDMLLKLPEGESVIWIDERWLQSIWVDSNYDLQLPDLVTVAMVKNFCKEYGIELYVTN
jgi:hypothetical protein